MIKRTVEISQQPAYLCVKDDQLLVVARDEERTILARIPCEDIGVVLVEHPATTFSHAALTRLLYHGAVLVICGRDHLPAGMLLPVGQHTRIVPRIHLQIGLRKPVRKRLWKQIVQAKIRAQADNFPPASPAHARLLGLARTVRSGDPTNVEAQAARAYWAAYRDELDAPDFRRLADGSPPNNLLNYGYAVLRAAVARAVVAAGFVPALGLHHHNRSNAFCLADDLIEPLRPLVDDCVRDLCGAGTGELDTATKTTLLELLTATVCTGDQTGPLMVALHHMVASLVRCYEGTDRKLLIPIAESEPPASAGSPANPGEGLDNC
ncbi:MAG: type II CRISPR-associated endonuclease Cas1 [Phycisphaerae bacterium]